MKVRYLILICIEQPNLGVTLYRVGYAGVYTPI